MVGFGAFHHASGAGRPQTKPVRSEWATTACNTAVRGLLSAPGSTGVAWVSTTLPVPSPSTIRTAMIMGSVMGSFAVEQFSVDGIRDLTTPRIQQRFDELAELAQFDRVQL